MLLEYLHLMLHNTTCEQFQAMYLKTFHSMSFQSPVFPMQSRVFPMHSSG